MSEITYIFGAGASCLSMPLVSNFAERFKLFQDYSFSNCNIPPEFANDINDFYTKVESSFSFDTFFKKLFHQNESESLIEKYKRVLLLYLLFEHLVDINLLKERSLYRSLKLKNLHKGYSLDPRYEALIAGLLKPIRGKAQFVAKVNFITWNYDINLLFALNNFIAPEESFSEFVNKRKNDNIFTINDQVKLFHLNGHILHPSLDYFNSEDSFQNFENFFYDDFKGYTECIKFAWEQDSINKDEIAKSVSNSDSVIITGYSLPLYNREIDISILNQQTLRRKNLYVQDLNAGGIVKLLDSDFDIQSQTKEDPTIVTSTNCNNFLIPSSIY